MLNLEIQLLYSRLLIFKTLGAKLAKAGPRKTNPAAAAGIGLSADDERFADAAHFYEFLLESCEKLFDNEIEVPLFEDQMRFMFGPRVNFSGYLLPLRADLRHAGGV